MLYTKKIHWSVEIKENPEYWKEYVSIKLFQLQNGENIIECRDVWSFTSKKHGILIPSNLDRVYIFFLQPIKMKVSEIGKFKRYDEKF